MCIFFRNRLDDLFGQIEREFESVYAENLACEYLLHVINLANLLLKAHF